MIIGGGNSKPVFDSLNELSDGHLGGPGRRHERDLVLDLPSNLVVPELEPES